MKVICEQKYRPNTKRLSQLSRGTPVRFPNGTNLYMTIPDGMENGRRVYRLVHQSTGEIYYYDADKEVALVEAVITWSDLPA
jgi:hypothetical protein